MSNAAQEVMIMWRDVVSLLERYAQVKLEKYSLTMPEPQAKIAAGYAKLDAESDLRAKFDRGDFDGGLGALTMLVEDAEQALKDAQDKGNVHDAV